MIHDLSGKEKPARLGAAEIAMGLMSGEVKAPRVPRRPESDYLKARGDIRPEVTPFPSDPPLISEDLGERLRTGFDDMCGVLHYKIIKRHENAAGKKLCGMCKYKMPIKGVWECFHSFPCPHVGECPAFRSKPATPRPPQPKAKGLPVPEGVKFLYFGRPPGLCLHQDLWRHLSLPKTGSRTHQGVVTVAWIEPTPGILHLGFSFCSPEDPWCKATGRDMAMARLLHPVVIPFLYSPKRTVHEVARAVLTHDFGRLAALTPGATMWGRVPSWTRGLGKRMGVRRVSGISKFVPFPIPIPLTIIARMMHDIAALDGR